MLPRVSKEQIRAQKIRVEQLTVGMHVKEFCGSWMEHPFWRTGFVIHDPKDCPGSTEKIASREDPAKWRFADLNELWSGLPQAPW